MSCGPRWWWWWWWCGWWWLSLLATVLPLASESSELMEPLMCEPLDRRLLPDGKGSLGAGDRQRGTPPPASPPKLWRLDELPVGDSSSWEGAAAEAKGVRSTSSPFTEPWSELRPTDEPSPAGPHVKTPVNLSTMDNSLEGRKDQEKA